jgi:hypothetical protein
VIGIRNCEKKEGDDEMDREKVINDLQDAVNDDWMWQHADYYAKAMENAIALLKEQEQAMKEKDGTISNLIAQIKEISQCYERVVRCKDCKNWIPGYITDQDDFIPPKCGKYQQMVGHSNDDFCSLAEKQEGR